LQEASDKGEELSAEVHSNMGFMKNINDNLTSITNDSLEIQKENTELGTKIAILRKHYDEKEKILQSALKETNDALVETRTEINEINQKSAEDKQKLYQEMEQLSGALVLSGEQMKESKETEAQLRTLLQSYEKKFEGLQTALSETNSAYETFKSEMGKVNSRTKDLDKESLKWQKRWEESNDALRKIEQNNAKLEGDLSNAKASLAKMMELCRNLQVERKNMLTELKTGKPADGKENKPNHKPVGKK
jgi:chromosome segregation ATPase